MRKYSIYLSLSRNFVSRPAVRLQRRLYATEFSKSSSPIGFAFDIDGVLTQGSHVLPQAKRVLKYLEGHNEWNRRFPYILMTNGGGKFESERCEELSERLEVPINPTMFMQSHTILGSPAVPILEQYRDKPILVLGGFGDKCRKIAHSYGYSKVFIPADILHWNPNLWPFYSLSEKEKAYAEKNVDFSTLPIHAIMVFHDPRNWALDAQIALDIVRYGTTKRSAFLSDSNLPSGSKVYQEEGGFGSSQMIKQDGGDGSGDRVEIIFCNPDLVWRGAYGRPRLGQGGFREAFQGIHQALEGVPYPAIQLGKPTSETYTHAESLLADRMRHLYGFGEGTAPNRQRIYMVGDNPESDIQGARRAGWNSILVHTGVYSPENGERPTHEPSFEARDVEEAVHLAIKREIEHPK